MVASFSTGMAMLISMTVLVGVYPDCLLNMINLSVGPLVSLLAR